MQPVKQVRIFSSLSLAFFPTQTLSKLNFFVEIFVEITTGTTRITQTIQLIPRLASANANNTQTHPNRKWKVKVCTKKNNSQCLTPNHRNVIFINKCSYWIYVNRHNWRPPPPPSNNSSGNKFNEMKKHLHTLLTHISNVWFRWQTCFN